MNWTSIYLKTSSFNVFFFFSCEVATRRANRFIDNGACVKLVGSYITPELKYKGASLHSSDEIEELVEWADLVILASGDKELSDYVSNISKNKLINRADLPSNGNVIVPTSFSIGDVEISIFTNGKSPLMAKQLRKKIQSIISDEDILEIEIQDYARLKLKNSIDNQKQRRDHLYNILNDENVNDFIKNHKINEAKEYIDNLIRGLN